MARQSPNLIFIFADQMRARDMGCAGDPNVATPNLDRMAREGVRFTNATSMIPVCTPARAALLTGRYPLSTGMFLNDIQMSIAETTIAHVLRDAGYDTAYIGKWHLDGSRRFGFTPPGPRRQGFDYWHALNCDHRDYLNPLYYEDSDEQIWPEQYATDYETDVALRYSENRDGPYSLFLSYSPPHNPYQQLPERWRGQIDPAALQLSPNTPDTEENRRDLAGYYAHIAAIDENIGRLLAAVGDDPNTIVVFWSDHGDMLGSHGKQRKQWPWDDSALVPLIVRWPGGLPQGEISPVLFNTVDFVPTLLGWMGVECPQTVEGMDLGPAIAGAAAGPTSAFLQVIAPFAEQVEREWRAVRTARHTYAETLEGPWLLYDNTADPDQLDNLAGRAEHADLQVELKRELGGWLGRTGDDFEPRARYLERYGYAVEGKNGAVPYTYALEEPEQGWPPQQVASRREDLP